MNTPDLDGECAICAAYGVTTRIDTATASRIPHDPSRDGLRVHPVYACAACAATSCQSAMSESEETAIHALRDGAHAAGDEAQVAICSAALRRDLAARLRVSLVIARARAIENDQ